MRIADHVRWRRFGAELVVLDLRTGHFLELSEIAARVFEGVGRGESVSALVDALVREFDVERVVLEGDVRHVVGDLLERGVLADAD